MARAPLVAMPRNNLARVLHDLGAQRGTPSGPEPGATAGPFAVATCYEGSETEAPTGTGRGLGRIAPGLLVAIPEH